MDDVDGAAPRDGAQAGLPPRTRVEGVVESAQDNGWIQRTKSERKWNR